MSTFKPFQELSLEPGQVDGLHRIVDGRGYVVIAGAFKSEDDAQRLVDCWNACRKIHSPAAHIVATDEYVARLEMLRKEAWARVESLESRIATASHGEAEAPSDDRVNPHRTGGDGANAGDSDVDRSAPRAPVEAGTGLTSLAGGLESGIDQNCIERNASGPDVKRAPISLGDAWSTDLSQAPRDGSPVISGGFDG